MEIKTLAEEHARLVDKKFIEGLTQDEEIELERLSCLLDKALEPFDLAAIEHLSRLP